MKRSEMLDSVAAKLIAHIGFTFTDRDISDILKIFEDEGMMPPTGPNWEYQYPPNGEGCHVKYKWEPENASDT